MVKDLIFKNCLIPFVIYTKIVFISFSDKLYIIFYKSVQQYSKTKYIELSYI